MRAIIFFVLFGLFGCFVPDKDGDGISNDADCDPNSIANACGDTAPLVDTAEPVDTAPPVDTDCESVTWYRDGDGDGYGNPAVTTEVCARPDGYVVDDTDCNDADVTSFPGASERCDGADNDCDGEVDENGSETWYSDMDRDGFGNPNHPVNTVCEGYEDWLVADNTDCNDVVAETHPGAAETCDGIDNDCDGEVDEEAVDATLWIVDADRDGYGDAELSEFVLSCTQPEGYAANAQDCDDANDTVNPGAAETYGDGIDQNCDGSDESGELVCCVDEDGDTYGNPEDCQVSHDAECPDGYVPGDGDCNDANATVHPDAYDSPYDTNDADCDGYED